jgi:hypothetical protein
MKLLLTSGAIIATVFVIDKVNRYWMMYGPHNKHHGKHRD